jgi:hypothetical protein
MPTITNAPSAAYEQRIRALEEELYAARQAIVELMPQNISDALAEYRSCSSYGDFIAWQNRVVAFITSTAEIDPEASRFEERGYCPLCRGGTRGPYQSGFKIPGGMEKHLLGDGNAHQCVVTEAAFRNARHALRDKFDGLEKAARKQCDERRTKEQTILIDPSLPSELLDEGRWWSKPRTPEGLEAAEQRLRGLNFEKEVSGNVVAYKLWYEGHLVLADPRRVGRITFRVFKDEKPRKGNKQVSFDLLDGWKNNLAKKFRGLLTGVCNTIPKKR